MAPLLLGKKNSTCTRPNKTSKVSEASLSSLWGLARIITWKARFITAPQPRMGHLQW
jgi:hypothetical protein